MEPKGIRFRVKEDLILLNGLRTQFEFEVNLGEISLVRTGIEKFTSGQFPFSVHVTREEIWLTHKPGILKSGQKSFVDSSHTK